MSCSLSLCLSACSSTAANSLATSPAATNTRSTPGVDGSGSPSAGGTASARIGDLYITGGYVPEQASPTVAAAYFTIANRGSRADVLTKVTTDVTSTVMAMNETDSGTTGSMTDLPKVVVPAHGSFRFAQGHAHLMLENPDRELKQGDRVRMTITFVHAGTVRLTLPVVGFTGPTSSSAAGSNSASAVPGMSMSMSGTAMSR